MVNENRKARAAIAIDLTESGEGLSLQDIAHSLKNTFPDRVKFTKARLCTINGRTAIKLVGEDELLQFELGIVATE